MAEFKEVMKQIVDECSAYPDDMVDCLIEIEQILEGE